MTIAKQNSTHIRQWCTGDSQSVLFATREQRLTMRNQIFIGVKEYLCRPSYFVSRARSCAFHWRLWPRGCSLFLVWLWLLSILPLPFIHQCPLFQTRSLCRRYNHHENSEASIAIQNRRRTGDLPRPATTWTDLETSHVGGHRKGGEIIAGGAHHRTAQTGASRSVPCTKFADRVAIVHTITFCMFNKEIRAKQPRFLHPSDSGKSGRSCRRAGGGSFSTK